MAGRLLLDENLSPRLARDLAASFPDSAHVRDVALKGQSDHQIWTVCVQGAGRPVAGLHP
jgi:predicted nuclease of predicted toxin-antitoxin system